MPVRRALREGNSDLMLDVDNLIRKQNASSKSAWRDAICKLIPDRIIIKAPLVDFEYEAYKRLCD